MIVYLQEKAQFLDDVLAGSIEETIHDQVRQRLGIRASASEQQSWRNSLEKMHTVMVDDQIPSDAGIAIEFRIPQTAKRIDFIVTGNSAAEEKTAVIIELKQWSEVKRTRKDAVVETYLGGGRRETNHPSYQAWSYAQLLTDFNEAVQTENIRLHPCTYLHNCREADDVCHTFYARHLEKAPVFLSQDAEKLRSFIKQNVKTGDSGDLMYRIRDGRIRPSKNLADHLCSLLQGNQEFLMIDDQKLVYETALDLAAKASTGKKQVLIVIGGPGTGKSVVAINLLVEFINREMVAQYVTKNAAPRAVYESMLTGTLTKSRISNLFKGSGAYVDAEPDLFDALVVDESHRLTDKSGMYRNQGENQIAEIIAASKLSIFFIDEQQRIHIHDRGSVDEIERCAYNADAHITQLELASQFRCNGSDGYLAWVDNTLQVRETANPTLEGIDYEFTVCDSPQELRQLIVDRNQVANKARMVAGYCWPWAGKKDPSIKDVVVPEHGFSAKWNLTDDGSLWIIKPESVEEIGCIHTSQGLELDYIGVIIGRDFVVRDEVAITDAAERASQDRSLFGFKKLQKESAESAEKLAEEIIKNTYRTLMTRGQKGCFVFSVDPETNLYLKEAAAGSVGLSEDELDKYSGLKLEVIAPDEAELHENVVPIFSPQVAAGTFSAEQWIDESDWAVLEEPFVAKDGYFLARVVGQSMDRRIPSGSWCLFKGPTGGSREGKVVLVQLQHLQEDSQLGEFTVKLYSSQKRHDGDGGWEHERIMLMPDSTEPDHEAIILEKNEAQSLRIIGEYVATLS